MLKLSELSSDSLLYREDWSGSYTAEELKHELVNLDAETAKEYRESTWCLGDECEWRPNARYMLEAYIESESDNMFEDWDETVSPELLDKDFVAKVQELLDEGVKSANTSYLEFVAYVAIDL